MVKIGSWFDPTLEMILPMWGKYVKVSNKQSIEILKIEYHDPKEAILIMARTMIQYGLIDEKKAKK